MTAEVKDESRRRWLSMKSKSSIGGSTAHEKKKQGLDPKHVLKASKKGSGKESRWFRKKSQSKESKEGSNSNGPHLSVTPETTDLEMEEKAVQRTVQGAYRDVDGGPSPKILQTTVLAARDAVKEFAKDFVSLLKTNTDGCASIEAQMRQQLQLETETPSAPATADLKFLAQAYIALHLFSGFENASFSMSNPGEKPWEVEEHMTTCFEQFQSSKNKTQTISKLLENKADDKFKFLSDFCMRKFRSLIPLDAESAMFGADLQHRTNLANQKHPNTDFYRSFLGAAVPIWLLQRLRCSFEQKVVTISPTRGDDYQRRYMLPAVPGIGDDEDEDSDSAPEILFTVFPGFRVSESIVKSLVYIVERPPPSPEVETSIPVADEVSSNVVNAPTEPEQALKTPEKDPQYFKSESLPVTPTTRRMETSATSVSKSLSTRETSDTKGPKRGILQRLRHKILHKKTSAKAKAADTPSTPTAPRTEKGEPGAQKNTPTATMSVAGDISPLEVAPSSDPAPSTSSKDADSDISSLPSPKAPALSTVD